MTNPLPTVFCLSSGRSGTHFLYEILRRNLASAVCQHEPYVWNPSMFGRPIYDRIVGDKSSLRRLAERKRKAIESYRGASAYLETSHAFLKSWSDLAMEFFPEMKLIHLVRNPLAVAKSEAVREELIHRWRLPLRNYRAGNGQRYFRWSLTGMEQIFVPPAKPRTRFQWYVIQWIEIENRAMHFLRKHGKQADCFTLHTPVELNDPEKVQALFDFLKLRRSGSEPILKGKKNRTPGVKAEITEQDRMDFAEVVKQLPTDYLEIFKQKPYCDWDWARSLTN